MSHKTYRTYRTYRTYIIGHIERRQTQNRDGKTGYDEVR